MSKKWDVFICHASDDKDTFVRPLAETLDRLGLRVWFDEDLLTVGDSLVRSIDEGLTKSRFGIVVLSRAFKGKKWTEHELRGLMNRDIDEGGIILPVWHGITREDVLEFSPSLADKLAIDTSRTPLEDAALQILRKVRPDLYQEHPRAVLLGMARDEPGAAVAKKASDDAVFLSGLATVLVQILVSADEADDRQVNPWFDAWRAQYASNAEELRELASHESANKFGVARNLTDLADTLDDVTMVPSYIGNDDELGPLMKKTADEARRLKAELIDSQPLADESRVEVPKVIAKSARRLTDLVERMQKFANAGRVEKVQDEASRIGAVLVQYGYHNVDSIQDGLGAALREIGHKLHLVETFTLYSDGGNSEREILAHIQEQHDALALLVRDLPAMP